MRTGRLRSNMPGLRLAGEGESGPVSTPFGPKRAGLTTSQRIQNRQLSELLSGLERSLQDLNSRYCEAYVTLLTAMEHLAKLSGSIIDSITTEEEDV